MLRRYPISPGLLPRNFVTPFISKGRSPMALIRWQPWQEMETLRRQLDQLFDDIAPATQDAFLMNRKAWGPAIELKNNDADIILRAELPGVDAKNLDIQVTREAVLISGEHRSETKTEEQRFVRSEFRYGSFRRIVPLPAAIKNDQVQADFKDGILTLTLPKAETPQVVKINLNGASVPEIESATEQPVAADQPKSEAPKPEAAESEDVWTQS